MKDIRLELYKLSFLPKEPNGRSFYKTLVNYPLVLEDRDNGKFTDLNTGIEVSTLEEIKLLWKLVTKTELK